MAKKEIREVAVTVENRTIIRLVIVMVILLFGLSFVKNISHALLIIFISFFLAMALNPAVTWISRKLKTKSRALATGAAYVLVIVFLAMFFSVVVPPLVRQTSDFIKEVPDTIQEFKRDDSSFNKFIDKYKLNDEIDRFSADFGNKFKDVGGPVLTTAGVIGSTVVNTITVLILTFMMLVEGPMWINRFISLISPNKRKRAEDLAHKMYKVVVGYVNGQVIVAAIGGTFAGISLFVMSQIFDASVNAIALGGIVGLFALLPLIGTTIGASIAVLACLLVSVPLAIAAVIYFVIYQQIENVTIQPYIQSRSNNLTPLSVLIAALLGVGFGGFLGAILAIPVAGCIKVLIDDYLARRSTSQAAIAGTK
jgi:predicted PurR-regulated permease PerM